MLQKFDPRNEHIYIYVAGELFSRDAARISVFDSAVQCGDAVWEGLRVYNGGVFLLDQHLSRLVDSAHALAFENIPSKAKIRQAVFDTLKANGMMDGAHIRLTLTRGEKITSGMDPRLNQKGSCLIVLAEWKPPVYDNAAGIRVISTSVRRNAPQFLDSKIHHSSMLNNILAKIQANAAGMDAALMLDDRGFVAELNGTNLFMVKNDRLQTPHGHACLPGITRSLVLDIGRELKIPVAERNISLAEFYSADEVFATGTMGELTPVVAIDGRSIGDGMRPVMARVYAAFREAIPSHCTPIS